MIDVFLHCSNKIKLNHALKFHEKIFKRQQDKMVVSYYKLTVYNNSMHFYELFQAQIEIFWINTLLTFDECFQQCSGKLQTIYKLYRVFHIRATQFTCKSYEHGSLQCRTPYNKRIFVNSRAIKTVQNHLQQ